MQHISLRALAGTMVLLSAAAPTVAPAQSGPNFTGVLEAEAADYQGGRDAVLYGDATFGYMFPPTGGGLAFGGEIGGEAIRIDGEGFERLHWALVLDSDAGTIRAGAPRPALDAFVLAPAFGGSRLADLQLRPFRASLTGFALLLSDGEHYGLSYEGGFGAARVGASVHRLADDDVTLATLAGSFEAGMFTAMAGIEHGRADGDGETDFMLGAKAGSGIFEGGVQYAHRDSLADSAAWTLWGTVSPIEGLDVTAQYLRIDGGGGGSADFYGLSAEYGLPSGAFVQGSVNDGDLGRLFDLSIGWRF